MPLNKKVRKIGQVLTLESLNSQIIRKDAFDFSNEIYSDESTENNRVNNMMIVKKTQNLRES